MSRVIRTSLIALMALGITQRVFAKAPFTREDPTGICARKLDWFDDHRQLQHHLETVIFKQSGTIRTDVRRKKLYERQVLRPYLPDMKPYTWFGAWISDTKIDQVHGPDCSKLPLIFER